VENTFDDIHSWSDRTLRYWANKNIPLQRGVSLEMITKTELITGLAFPYSFKVLYQKVNGFKDFYWNQNLICFWSLTRIEEEFGRYPNFVGFGDFLICSHVYGFLKDQQGIFKAYDLKDPGTPEKIAETFEESIDLINKNSNLLY
jgi:hypothetical protein